MNNLNYENIKKFEEENELFLKNNIICSFLDIPAHKELYLKTISNPTAESKEELDILFKQFYLKIRFVSHISTTLKFNSINFDKRIRNMKSKLLLTLDAPINSESDETFLDTLTDNIEDNSIEDFLNNTCIKEHATDDTLYNALHSLTENQLTIINLAYIEGLSDTEIAKRLNKTQQAVSKSHKAALQKLASQLKKGVD